MTRIDKLQVYGFTVLGLGAMWLAFATDLVAILLSAVLFLMVASLCYRVAQLEGR